ncbi:hypothetical protein [Endothiovibrio diazotrophicus]
MNKPLIGAATVAALLFVGYAGASYHKNSLAREQVDRGIAKAMEGGKITVTYGGVDAALFGNEVVIESMKILPSEKSLAEMTPKAGMTIDAKRGITIDRVTFDVDAYQEEVPPKRFNLEMAGFHVPLDLSRASEAERKTAARMGYGDEFVMDLKADFDHQPEQKSLQFTAANTLRDQFTFGFSADLGNFDAAALRNPETAQNAGLGLTLKRIELHYDDDGMAEKAIGEAAEREGISVDEVKAKWKAELASGANQAAAGRPHEFARAALDEIGRFIDEPNRLTIGLHPAEAVPVMAIVMGGVMDPAGTWKKLNVTVKAN